MPTDNYNDNKPKKAEELDDTLAWLEELALDAEEPAPPPKKVEPQQADQTPESTVTDEQLSWLDELTADEEPLEEQPTLSWEHTKPTGDLLSPSLPLGNKDDSGTQEWDDAINWLEELSDTQEETSPEELENLLDEQEQQMEAPVEPAPEPPKEEAPAKKPRGGGMFGAEEDFTISAEEIAAAAAHGAEVEGFDFPDDDEAAMAWLEGLIGDDEPLAATEPETTSAVEQEEAEEEPDSLFDDLLALAEEAEDDGLEGILANAAPADEDDALFDDLLALADETDDIVVDVLAGEEDPLLADLTRLADEQDETAEEAVAEIISEPEPAPEPPAKKPKSGGMFGAEEDFTISAEEIAAAAAHGAEVEGFDFPDDDEAAMAWLEGLIGDGGMDALAIDEEPALTADVEATVEEPAVEESEEGEDDLLDDLLALAEEEEVEDWLGVMDDAAEEETAAAEEMVAEVVPEPEPAPEPPAKKPKSGGMFGAEEDFTISAEEIAAAAAHGAEVEGFDFPDDDEAAMAWLEGLIGDGGMDALAIDEEPALTADVEATVEEPAIEESEEADEGEDDLLDDLLALAEEEEVEDWLGVMDDAAEEETAAAEEMVAEVAPEPEPAPEPSAKKPKSGGMFGAEEDFTISAEEIAAAAAHGAEVEGFDFPDDDEAAMAWLEGLIGDDGMAELAIDEEPAFTADVEATVEAPAVEEAEEIEEAEDDLLDDLLALAEEEDADDWLGAMDDLAEEEEAVSAVESAADADLDDDLFDDLMALTEDDEADVAGDALLGQLMDLADEQEETDDQQVLEEMAFSTADDDDPLAWLEGVGSDLEDDELDDESLMDMAGFPAADEDEDEDIAVPNFNLVDGMPEDPDEAMALLERLAAEQYDSFTEEMNASLSELQGADMLGAVEDESALLEAADTADVDHAVEEDDLLAAVETEPVSLDEIDEGDLAGSDLFDDLDLGLEEDGLSWLDDEADMADLPEDPDEAMALLEQLSTDEEEDLDDDDNFDELLDSVEVDDVLQEESFTPTQDDLDDVVDDLFPEAVSSALPDWLAISSPDSADGFDTLNWLDEGGADGGILGWLESEEEVSQKGPEKPALPQSFDTFDMISSPSTLTPSKRMQAEPSEPEEVKPKARPVYDPAIFRPARGMLSAGDVEGALEEYEQFISSSGDAAILVDELEQVVDGVSHHPLIRRLLGDAYMRNGQLQEALNCYAVARDQL